MRAVIAIIVFSLSSVIGSHARIVPTPGSESLQQLYEAAFLVFRGEIVSVEHDREIDGIWGGQAVRLRVFTAKAVVDRQYKGPLDASRIEIVYRQPTGDICAVSKCETLNPGDYGLFFLAQDSEGYHMLNTYAGKFAVSRLKSEGYSAGVGGVEADLIAGLKDNDKERLVTNVELIGLLPQVRSLSPLVMLLASERDQKVQGATYVALLRLRSYSKLQMALDFAETPRQDSRTAIYQEQICELTSEIHDPVVVPTLLSFSHSKSDRVRESVIHSLRNVGSKEALPVFIQALDDPVKWIRYDAVLGLAALERKWDLAPSVDAFSEDEEKYISAWKTWWASSGVRQ